MGQSRFSKGEVKKDDLCRNFSTLKRPFARSHLQILSNWTGLILESEFYLL